MRDALVMLAACAEQILAGVPARNSSRLSNKKPSSARHYCAGSYVFCSFSAAPIA
ncbi:MAG: hypothetical protein KA914_08865 [Ottowia sp.]|jgi:hypothetical protein|nr:hypothetical protein [Ottowia sp.]